jgi:hypothetical protein
VVFCLMATYGYQRLGRTYRFSHQGCSKVVGRRSFLHIPEINKHQIPPKFGNHLWVYTVKKDAANFSETFITFETTQWRQGQLIPLWTYLRLHTENGGGRFLWNVGKHVFLCQQLRRQLMTYTITSSPKSYYKVSTNFRYSCASGEKESLFFIW